MEETKVLTIVFTDIKGFTERTSHSDRESVSRLLKNHEEILLPLVSNYDGTLIKTIGDAFLLTFGSPTNAVLCAIMMQEKLKLFNSSLPAAEKIEIRIAMNTGEVLLKDGDIFGEPVNVASRIEGITEANEVWFSESTYLSMNRQEAPTSLIGEYRLKGIPEAVRVYRVVRDEKDENYLKTVQNQLEKIKNLILVEDLPRASAKSTRIPYYFAIALIILVIFLVSRESNLEKQIRLSQEAHKGGNFRLAIECLKNAAKHGPYDPRITRLLTSAIDKHVEQRLALEGQTVENVLALETYLKETRTLFSALDAKLLKSEINLALIKADLFAKSGKRNEADELLDQLALRAKTTGAILFKIGEFYKKYGYNWTRTIRYFHAAANADPVAYATHPAIISEFAWFLDKVLPHEGFNEVREFILEHCYANFASKLQAALYSEGKDYHTLRWNAFKMLPGKGVKIDFTRFYLVDLLTSPGSVNSLELNEVVEYFEKKAGPAMGAEIDAKIAQLPQQYPLFESFLFKRDAKPMKIAAGPLYFHLEKYLHGLLNSDNTSTRFNAYTALKMRNGATSEEVWAFCARNVCEFRALQWSNAYYPTLIESLDYLIQNPVPLSFRTNKAMVDMGQKTAQNVQLMLDQEIEAAQKKKDMRFFKEYERTKEDMEALIKKLKTVFFGKK